MAEKENKVVAPDRSRSMDARDQIETPASPVPHDSRPTDVGKTFEDGANAENVIVQPDGDIEDAKAGEEARRLQYLRDREKAGAGLTGAENEEMRRLQDDANARALMQGAKAPRGAKAVDSRP
jgi:hypothetical protein